MSMTLNDIYDRFPNWLGPIYGDPYIAHVFKSSGLPIGCLYQDKSRCIYESYIYNGTIHALENAEFLSNFKHKHLLTLKSTLYTQYIYVLKEFSNETSQDTR